MLLERKKTNVCIFNMQDKFIPHFHNYKELSLNCQWLADLCQALNIRCFIVEHKELGKRPETFTTVAKEATRLVTDYFDFLEESHIAKHLNKHAGEHYILAGAETHVSIFQSAIGLKKKENSVFILADTSSARSEVNHNYGLQRALHNGIEVITREMLFFEMIRTTEDPQYVDLAKKFIPSTLDNT